jgi:DNA-binding transcriptional ArsR family regulator
VSGNALADIAKLISNPTAAVVLDTLLSDRKLTVSGIASETGIARSTVSEAVASLAKGGLVIREKRGRTTVVRLAGQDVADALEGLGRLAQPTRPIGLRAVSRMEALRRARTCYDHLAGELGFTLADRLLDAAILTVNSDGMWSLLPEGAGTPRRAGPRCKALVADGRRPLIRVCSDWTERRPHLAGRLGARICSFWLQAGLAQRLPESRALRITPAGQQWLARI